MIYSGDIKRFRPRGLPRSSDKKENKQATGLMTSLRRLTIYGDCPRRKTLTTIFGSKHAIKNSYFWVPVQARNQEVFGTGEVSWNMAIPGILR